MFFKEFENNLSVREVSVQELWSYADAHFESIFSNRVNDYQNFPIDEASGDKIKKRRQADNRYHLRLVMLDGDKLVGWHYGYEINNDAYYMQNSAILEEYRGQGLYTKLLEAVIDKLAEEGFQEITSTHHPHNAAVLIPKLKKGFFISGIQFNERFRSLVEMKYIYNENRRKAYFKNLGLAL